MYWTYINDERRSHRENPPRPCGLWGKCGQTLLLSSTVVPPQPSDSALSGRIFPHNATCSKVDNRLSR